MLTVNGAGYVPGSQVQWNGISRITTFVSSTQLTATILASDIATGGTAQVTVLNPAPGGGTSNALSFTINNPRPTVTSLFPSCIAPGTLGIILVVRGTNFVPNSVVRWNGADRETLFGGSTRLDVRILSSDVANPGSAQITVFNPPPGGDTSNAFTVGIQEGNPTPFLNSTVPSRATAGDTGFPLRVIGFNFLPSSVVRWNGVERPTTFVNGGELNIAVTPGDVASVGAAEITVFSPPPCGGPSNGRAFPIEATNPAPFFSGISPIQRTAGGLGFIVEVQGSNFVLNSAVRWNGADRPTTFFHDGRLQASIPASDIATSGTTQVTVFNPAPGGGTSNALTFKIVPLKIATSRLPDTTAGKDYDFRLAVEGGTGGQNWEIVARQLPPDLKLDPIFRDRISGRVAAVASDTTFNFTVQLSDDTGVSTTRNLSITVRAGGLGRNDTCTPGSAAGTTRISNGWIRASLSPYGDVDVYSFEGTAGAKVTLQTLGQQLGAGFFGNVSNADTVLELLDSNCNLLAFNDDMTPGIIVDSLIKDFPLPSTGTFFIRIRDFRGDGRPDMIYILILAGAN